MRVVIEKGAARGAVSVPPSKSIAHRLLIAAALSRGESRISNLSDCDDVRATVDCLSALGADFRFDGDTVFVKGINITDSDGGKVLECRESGSTLRFLAPLAMLTKNGARLHGASSLMARPMTVYEELFGKQRFTKNGDFIDVKGPLAAGDYTVSGNISSQFITGLIFALTLLSGDSTIHITPPIESRSYINLTLDALSAFGIQVAWQDDFSLFIRGGQSYTPSCVSVEADASGAAFPAALNYLGGEVKLLGLSPDSRQGDAVFSQLFREIANGAPTVDISDCPDLAPILFALAAAKHGATFIGTRRLRIKESDRAAAMAEELSKLGAELRISEDSVVVKKAPLHPPSSQIFGHNDHRIVMAMSILLTLFGGEISGAEAVKKSYPHFFSHLASLGIGISYYDT